MKSLLLEIAANLVLALLFYYLGVALFGDSRWVSGCAAGLSVLIVRLFVRYRRHHAHHT